MPRTIAAFAALLVALVLTSGSARAQASALDLSRFDGRWFEIERSPNDLQKSCWRAQIDLTPRSARGFDVLVSCTRTRGGPIETLRATARAADGANARLRFTLRGLLSFGGLAGQNYWVWDHAPDYSWAILALPDRSDWWIWHREREVAPAERQRLLARARALGLDTRRTVSTPPSS